MISAFVQFVFSAIKFLIFVRIILSFIPTAHNNPIGRFVYEVTEPLLSPIRRILPSTGMLDFSPLVLFILLDLIQRFVSMYI